MDEVGRLWVTFETIASRMARDRGDDRHAQLHRHLVRMVGLVATPTYSRRPLVHFAMWNGGDGRVKIDARYSTSRFGLAATAT